MKLKKFLKKFTKCTSGVNVHMVEYAVNDDVMVTCNGVYFDSIEIEGNREIVSILSIDLFCGMEFAGTVYPDFLEANLEVFEKKKIYPKPADGETS